MDTRFTEFGMWRLPERVEKLESTAENREALSLEAAFCPKGHNLLDSDGNLAGGPGIVLSFTRPNGETGKVLISPRLEDLAKKVLEGDLVRGERVSLFCPVCGTPLPVLAQCDRCHTGDMCVLYCSPALSIEDSVAFCNVVGCPNAMLIRSDRVIRALERDML